MKVIIGGKEYELQMTVADLENIESKYDLSPESMKKMTGKQYRKFVFDVAHRFLKKKKFFKPFITTRSMKRTATFSEYLNLCTAIIKTINGEDPESGNVSASGS